MVPCGKMDWPEACIVDEAPLLVLAAKAGRADLVSLLLEHGARVDDPATFWAQMHVTDEDGREFRATNALIIAARLGHREVVKLLIEAGANVKASISDFRPQPKKTPLGEAVLGGHQRTIDLLKAHGAE